MMFEYKSIFIVALLSSMPSLADSDDTKGRVAAGTCGQVPFGPPTQSLHILGDETEAPLHSVPWIVSLRDTSGNHFCGGSLLRIGPQDESDIIVTAAHCLPLGIAKVHLGAHYRSRMVEGEIAVGQIQTIKHHDYDPFEKREPDIAVVKLARPISFSKTIQPICLPCQTERIPDGTMLVVAGWGQRTYGGNYSEELRRVVVPIVGEESCQQNYAGLNATSTLCAGEAGKDSCDQDSGGPLYFREARGRVMHGVVSRGNGCGKHGFPGLYVRVSTYVEWINEQIRQLSSMK